MGARFSSPGGAGAGALLCSVFADIVQFLEAQNILGINNSIVRAGSFAGPSHIFDED